MSVTRVHPLLWFPGAGVTSSVNWANAASWMLSTVPNTGADQFARLEEMSAALEAYKNQVMDPVMAEKKQAAEEATIRFSLQLLLQSANLLHVLLLLRRRQRRQINSKGGCTGRLTR